MKKFDGGLRGWGHFPYPPSHGFFDSTEVDRTAAFEVVAGLKPELINAFELSDAQQYDLISMLNGHVDQGVNERLPAALWPHAKHDAETIRVARTVLAHGLDMRVFDCDLQGFKKIGIDGYAYFSKVLAGENHQAVLEELNLGRTSQSSIIDYLRAQDLLHAAVTFEALRIHHGLVDGLVAPGKSTVRYMPCAPAPAFGVLACGV